MTDCGEKSGNVLRGPCPLASKSRCWSGGDLVGGRIGYVVCLNTRRFLDEFVQFSQHFGIAPPVVGVRLLPCIPQADSDSFYSARSNERNFVTESFLLAKNRE